MDRHRHLLSGLLPRAAADRPTAVAATCDQVSLTWGELEDRVGRLAATLLEVGVRPGDRVGIHLHKSIESLVAVHGILRAGAAYVPIDPLAPVATIATIAADCGIGVLVTHELRRSGLTRLAAGPGCPPALIGLDRPLDLDGDGADGSGPSTIGWSEVDQRDPIEPVDVLGDDLAYVMYTSGSTGAPKGIMHTHRSGLAYATMAAELYELGPADRMANIAPLHFDQSTFELLAGVAVGARIVLVPEPHLRMPASLTALLADQGCTTLYTVPSLFQQMLAQGGLADRDLSAVRWVLPGGEVFPPAALGELMAVLPQARVSNVYGPAEVNQCTFHHVDRAGLDALGGETLPIGVACPDAEVRVVDDDDRPVTAGEQGQLLVRTATMMAGYWRRPDLDEAAFVIETGAGGQLERWYRTGDVVSVGADGLLRYHGRRDNQVKLRGNRVELEQVESALGSLAAIEQAVAGVRPGPGGTDVLVARYLAVEPGDDPDPMAWRQELAATLPPYAVPSLFEGAESFPLTPSGKIDRRAVREAIALTDDEDPSTTDRG